MRLHISGDSLAARAEGTSGPTLNQLLSPPYVVVNTARSGDSSQDILERLEQDILSDMEPQVFILLVGANDLATHKQVPLAAFRANVHKIIGRVKKAWPACQLLLITPPAVDEEKQRYRTNYLVEKYGQVLKDLAREEGVTCLDFYHLLLQRPEPLSDLMEGIMDDGLHFGYRTYEILAAAIQSALEELPGY